VLSKSDTNVADTLKLLMSFHLDVAFLVPTETGLGKSILDATASVRDFLVQRGLHDFGAQPQGQDAKVVKQAFFVYPDRLEETKVSLYRPPTKQGDPRLWISCLGRYAQPYNLLALIESAGVIYVVNCSREAFLRSAADETTPLGQLAMSARPAEDPVVPELLGLMKDICRKGYVRTIRRGDTGIGMTLEWLLGIAENSERTPDFKGIELKAKRIRSPGRASQATLFSQVPNWALSPIGSAWNLLHQYGYVRDGVLRLAHEITARGPNSLGFFLEVEAAQDWLRQNHREPVTGKDTRLIVWEMVKLRQRLMEKHPQTFWVNAHSRGVGADEEFHYVKVEHTRAPSARNFETLLEAGLVSVHYLMKERTTGHVRDHGYLFKIDPRNFGSLFPPSNIYDLAC
jgi:hypothetical protein